MNFLYGLLGGIAKINERLSRQSVNLVPINWGLAIALAVLCGVSLHEYREGIANGSSPREVQLNDILNHRDVEHNFVAVRGQLYPAAGFQYVVTSKNSKKERLEKLFVPMSSESAKRLLIVQVRDLSLSGKTSIVDARVVGMLRKMDNELSAQIRRSGGKIGEAPVDMSYMLVEGEAPGDPVTWGILGIAAALILAALVVTFVMRYTVFKHEQISNGGMVSGSAAVPEVVTTTAHFVFDGGTVKRFHQVPAFVHKGDDNFFALLANVDASSRFMGVTTKKLEGVWSLTIRRGTPLSASFGKIFFGFKGRPALKLSYVDALTNKRRRAVLGFSSESERQAFYADLNGWSGGILAFGR